MVSKPEMQYVSPPEVTLYPFFESAAEAFSAMAVASRPPVSSRTFSKRSMARNGRKKHEYISCYVGRCAFYQKPNGRGGSIADAQRLAREIVEHGCESCGSCPVDYPDSNNVNDVELTVNYVSDACMSGSYKGVCLSFQD